MIDLDPKSLLLAKTILSKHLSGTGTTVYVFESRTTFKAKKFSDLDICLYRQDKLSSDIIWALKNDFEESNFPYFVDIVNYDDCDPTFQKITDQTKVHWLNF